MRPKAHSIWKHREKGGEYHVLTIAKGTGRDHGEEFVYYMGVDRERNCLTAFVRRLSDWNEAMEEVK